MFTNVHSQILKAATIMVVVALVAGSMPMSVDAFEPRGNTSSAKWVSQSPGSATGGSTVVYANPDQVLAFSLTIKNTSKTDVFYSAHTLQDEPAPYVGAHELRVGIPGRFADFPLES